MMPLNLETISYSVTKNSVYASNFIRKLPKLIFFDIIYRENYEIGSIFLPRGPLGARSLGWRRVVTASVSRHGIGTEKDSA